MLVEFPPHQQFVSPSFSTCTTASTPCPNKCARVLSLTSSRSEPRVANTWMTPRICSLSSVLSPIQNRGTAYEATPRSSATPLRASRRLYSVASGMVRRSFFAELLMSGMEDIKIRMAMMHDASGSHPFHPVRYISPVETMTAALPIVSARTCSQMPYMFSLSCEWEWPPWE